MSAQPSTIRASNEQTVGAGIHSDASRATVPRILARWRQRPGIDPHGALEIAPLLTENKSLFLDYVLEEFKLQQQEFPAIDIHNFCLQFEQFGSAIEHSIIRALEVQDYIDRHPELLQYIADFEWPTAGNRLQEFQVIEELGRGALARVYLCRDTDLGQRLVVVKVARGGDYEAALLGRLDHPNIVPVYSVTDVAERYVSYICMPYRGRSTLQDVVDHISKHGVPLRAETVVQIAQDSPCSGEQSAGAAGFGARHPGHRGSFANAVLRIAIELADALAYAHNIGIFHGDLKPSNVLLTPQGKPLLIDFNLAKDRRSDIGPRGGTLAYMPPEQLVEIADCAESDLVPYDVRSEIYTFGALLFQLFTGDAPFVIDPDVGSPADAAKSLIAQQKVERPTIRAKNTRINAELEALILRCLAINPADRPSTMLDVRRELQTQYRPIPRFRRFSRGKPILTALSIIALLSASAFAFLFVVFRAPYVERELDRAIKFQGAGDFQRALLSLGHVLDIEPRRQDALYERAKVYLLRTDLPGAITDFTRLSSDFGDPRSAAYAGYCFNLRSEHAAAIKWYERAVNEGFATVGLHNNLGVSYAISQSELGKSDRFAAAERHLQLALGLNSQALSVRGNLVTLALIRSEQESGYDPTDAVEHLEFLVNAAQNDPRVLTDAVRLYAVLSLRDPIYVQKCISTIESSLRAGGGPTAEELSSNPNYDAIRSDSMFAKLYRVASNARSRLSRGTLPLFLDPITGQGTNASSR